MIRGPGQISPREKFVRFSELQKKSSLWVRARSQIARTRALFDRFSAMSADPETEMWSEQDLKFQPRLSSARRQPIVPFSVCEIKSNVRPRTQRGKWFALANYSFLK